MRIIVAAALAALVSPAAQAEVKSAAAGNFLVENKAVLAAEPAQAYAMLVRVGEWWNGQHSHSGDAANLSIEARAGGCFCERLPASGGSVEHARVVFADPGRMLRLQGGLGPLQGDPVAGTLTWTLKAVPGGTEIMQSYAVSGFIQMGGEALAPMVDSVMAEQLTRLQARLAR
jgi:hypothetical protein